MAEWLEPVPVPVPFPVRFTAARLGDYLLLTSSDRLIERLDRHFRQLKS